MTPVPAIAILALPHVTGSDHGSLDSISATAAATNLD
jgi:hypothetical protein